MNRLPLVITRKAISEDPALQPGNRGARKIVVTDLYPAKEVLYQDSRWFGSSDKTPVCLMSDTELALFTNETLQDRHFHKAGTEFYSVLEGVFCIEVDGKFFELTAGETIVVPPLAVHEVFRDKPFIAQVITVHCGGVDDKFVAEKTVS